MGSNESGYGGEALAAALLAENDLDLRRLTELLNRAGFEGALSGIRATVVGTGQVGENVRCHLEWEGGDPGGERPDSVVVKLASSNATSRAAAAATRTYVREVGFYRDVATEVAIRVPTVHHLSEDRPANRFVLVMEDVAPAEAGDQLTGCSPERAGLAVDAAADLHGSTWGRTDLVELDWVDEPSAARRRERTELFRAVFPGFVETYGERLGREDLDVGRWLVERFDRWQEARSEPQCLVHGDFRLDNLLFGLGPPAPDLVTVDWQTVGLGPALSDVAYLLSGSLQPAELRRQEPDLLDRYRARLATHGVGLTPAEVERDYRLSAPAGYAMAVIASQIVGRTDRGDRMFLVMARGSAAQTRDLDTAGLV